MALEGQGISFINHEIGDLEKGLVRVETCHLSDLRQRLTRIETKLNEGTNNSLQTNPKTPATFCELLRQLSSQSTLHGLPNIFSTTVNWIKVFWVVLLFGTGMAVWQTADIVKEYFRYNVLTITEVHKGDVKLPQITFCNNNGFLKSRLLKEPRITDVIGYDLENSGVFLSYLISLLPEKDRIMLSHNISDFVTWSYDNSSMLSYTQLPTFWGTCYEFVQMIQNQNIPTIILKVNFNFKEYVAESIKASGTAYLVEKGIYPHVYSEPYITVEAGFRTFVYLKMETIIRKNGKYRKCQDGEEEFFEETGIPYSENACKAVCVSKETQAQCGCINYLLDGFPSRFKVSRLFANTPDCIDSRNACYFNKSVSISEGSYCDCKPRCHVTKYIITDIKKTEITDSDYWCEQWDECSNKTNETDRHEWVMNNAGFLNVRFSDIEHKEYRQVPAYPLSRFLSDIGGTLGLYMGVSLLTLAEIPQLIVGAIIFCIKRKLQQIHE